MLDHLIQTSSKRSTERRTGRAQWPARIAAVALLVTVSEAAAQRAPGTVELEMGGAALSAGFDPWWSVQLRAVQPAGSSDVLRAEVMRAERFGAAGTYLLIGDTHWFNQRWSADLSVGHGADGFFLPDLRVDAFLNRTLGTLVARIGAGYVNQPDAHSDRNLALGASWYAAPGWVFQGDARLSWSDPGTVFSTQQAVAATRIWGLNSWVIRGGWGREAYQIVGPSLEVTDFPTRELSLVWRRELPDGWGTSLRLDGFHAPHYERAGVSAGIFRTLR